MARPENFEEWGEIAKLSEADKGKEVAPVVFNFRPTEFVKVAPERRADWERFFAENVGLPPNRDFALNWHRIPDETVSRTGPDGEGDDCDFW